MQRQTFDKIGVVLKFIIWRGCRPFWMGMVRDNPGCAYNTNGGSRLSFIGCRGDDRPILVRRSS